MPYFDDLWNAGKDQEQPGIFSFPSQPEPVSNDASSDIFFTPDVLKNNVETPTTPQASSPIEAPTAFDEFAEIEGSLGGKIKVLGIGGAGCNAVNRMIEDKVQGVEFVAVNTDIQVLKKSLAKTRIAVGTKITRGLGAGAKPEIGEKAAQESTEDLKSIFKDTDMVFITAGMGGGTGTGAAPVIAQIAKESGCLVVAVVTLPFSFEGAKRNQTALAGVDKLRAHVDTSLVISNSKIFELVSKNTPVTEAFKRIDEVLKQAVQGIAGIVSETGLINVDFNDVKTVLANRGEAIMGIGMAKGEGRAHKAAQEALTNPLIENSDFRHAGAMVAKIIGGPDFDMKEYDEAAAAINGFCRENAEVVIGLDFDEKLKDQVKIIVVATNLTRETPLQKQAAAAAAEKSQQPADNLPEELPPLSPMDLPIHGILNGETAYLDRDEDWGLYPKGAPQKESSETPFSRRVVDFAPRREMLNEEEQVTARRAVTAPVMGSDLETPTFLRRKKRILNDNE
ncbi:MAG: cell division protein FtsZ [Brevinema sp.]